MKQPNILWRMYFKWRVKRCINRGYKRMSWNGELTPAQKKWILSEFPFTIIDPAWDEWEPIYDILFGKVQSKLDVLNYYV